MSLKPLSAVKKQNLALDSSSYNYYFGKSVKPVPVEIRPVGKGTVEITVSESGKLELGEQQTIKSPQENATVEQVNVTQGDKIEAGEALIVLRDRDTQEQEQDQKLENAKIVLAQEKNQKRKVFVKDDRQILLEFPCHFFASLINSLNYRSENCQSRSCLSIFHERFDRFPRSRVNKCLNVLLVLLHICVETPATSYFLYASN